MTEPTLPPKNHSEEGRLTLRRVGFAILALVALMGFFSLTLVETGQVGIVTRSGSVQPRTLSDPGLYLRIPFIERVWLIDTRLQVSEQLVAQAYTLADGQQLQLSGWFAWRVTDPVRFSEAAANGTTKIDDRLLTMLGDVMADRMRRLSLTTLLGKDMDPLAATWLAPLNEQLVSLGVQAERMGLRQVGLSEATTEAIFVRMGQAETRSSRQMLDTLKENERQVLALQTRQRDQVLEVAYQQTQQSRKTAETAVQAAYVRRYGPSESMENALKSTPSAPGTSQSPPPESAKLTGAPSHE